MKCPYCGYMESKVVDSRPTSEGEAIRRRRECIECKNRFTTYENIEEIPVMIVKKDGTRESYNRNKILGGVIKSCEKRPISIEEIEKAVDDIEKEISNSLKKEVSSEKVGQLVMDKLKELDEVAYVRFASVYKQFKDVNSFMDELKEILNEN
ncbi:MAG TPA: transcriptional regulator NrdR [Tissierellaceae bacterium]